MNPTPELKPRPLGEPRMANSGEKISFDQDVPGRLVFSNTPRIPALLKPGTEINFHSPVVVIGGELKSNATGKATYYGDFIAFEHQSIKLSQIRGDNWFEVL